MQVKNMTKEKTTQLADILKTNKSLEFQHKNLHYQIFESSELGYCVNVYSSNDKDENGDYLDSNLLDGGVCIGSASDTVEFML